MDDHELLQNYANTRCQESFAALVSRYVNLVYSAALRQLRDHHKAEEAVQAVFIVLARKARAIGPDILLGGWLLQTTSYAVRNLLRADQRRKRHERKAAQMNTIIENDPASAQAWEQIAPLLDEGIRKLPAKSRDAVILRYLEDRSSEEVARRLGISKEAARQRLSRAVELLRQYFQHRGVAVPAMLVGSLLATQSIHAAPAALVASAVSCASIATPLSKGILTMITISKLKAVAAILVGLFLFSATTAALLQAAPRPTPAPPVAPPIPAAAAIAQAPADTTISGTIVDSTGRPVADAEVLLADKEHPVYVYGQTLPLEVMLRTDDGTPLATRYDRKPANQVKTITGADGRFSFTVPPAPSKLPRKLPANLVPGKGGTTPSIPPDPSWKPDPIYQIVVRADDGFAELFVDDLPQNGQIILHPWGKIQGTLTMGGKPRANETLYLSRWPRLDDKTLFTVIHDQTVRTDADGRFVVSQIAPGDIWITRRLRPIAASITQFAYVNLKPAETALVTLGGGRTVIGHLTEPKGSAETILWQGNGNWTEGTVRLLPEHPFKSPADWYKLTAAQQHARMEEWGKTTEGQAAKASLFSLSFLVEPDGTLTIPDLASGQYEMKIQTSQGPDLSESVSSINRTVEIEKPASPGETFDLGALEVKLHPRLLIGDPAPNFECQTLAGTPLKLSAYQGKYVLLYFCENSTEQSVNYADALKVIHTAYAKEDRLAIITLHADVSIDQAKEPASSKNADWPQGYIGANSKIQADYHATTALIFLIGPDGKVVARHLTKETLPRAVAAALGKPR